MMNPVEGADHVGILLREAREAIGFSVVDVAQILRIRRVYLEAIENGRFDELPGATYAVGFVRSYAEYLRLDVPEIVERFKEEVSASQSLQGLDFPTPLPEGRFPGGILVALSLIISVGAFGGWYWYQNQNGLETVRIPEPPAPAAPAGSGTGTGTPPPAAPEPAQDDVAGTGPGGPPVPPSYLEPREDPLASMADIPPISDGTPGEATVAAADGAGEPPAADLPPAEQASPGAAAPEDGQAGDAAAPSVPPPPDPVETAATEDGRSYGVVNSDARIVLSARENTWIQVRDADENVVLTRMLRAGDKYFVPNQTGLRLVTGNAGGLDISVDGEPVPAIGRRSAGRRHVRLDIGLLKAGTAVVR